MDAKKLEQVVQNELKPIKAEVQKLDEENRLLHTEAEQLQSSIDKLEEAKKELSGKLTEALDLIEKVRNQNKRLVRETKFIQERAKKRIETEKHRLVEANNKYLDTLTQQVEDHVNVVTNAAFKKAKTLFESDISVVEKDLMKQGARLFAPYIDNFGLPKKLEKMKQETEQAINEAKQVVAQQKQRTEALEKKLHAALKENKDLKLDNYRNKIIEKLPSTLQETARVKMEKAQSPEAIRRIYLTVQRESQNQTTEKPEVATREKVKPAPKVVKENKTEQPRHDVQDEFDDLVAHPPESILKLARGK